MDETSLVVNIIVGTIGSVLGGLIVYAGQRGFQVRRAARARAAEERDNEETLWRSLDLGIRQKITNEYLFSILRFLFLGNLLWLIPNLTSGAFSVIDRAKIVPNEILQWAWGIIGITAQVFAVIAFLLGIGRILRYARLRALDPVPEEWIAKLSINKD